MARKRRKRSAGGLLIGPSHEEGGILATTPGMPDVELEGGEYIINAQTVSAVGVEFLDELNSTQTTYHTGGFGAGELPNPSNYRRGGVIRKKRRGGSIRKMYHGGPHGNGNGNRNGGGNGNPVTETFFAPQSPRYYRPNGILVPIGAPLHRHQDGTVMTEHSMNPTDNSVVVTTQLKRGGRINNNGRSKMRRGGRPTTRRMRKGGRPTTRRTMKRGGNIKRMPHGGPHGNGRNGCPPGMMMQNGECVTMPSGMGGYRKGGNIRRMQDGGMNGCPDGMVFQNGGCVPNGMRRGGNIKRMPHGGPHNGNGNGRQTFCPNGNYTFDEYGNQVCA